jgi:hypothetical protein
MPGASYVLLAPKARRGGSGVGAEALLKGLQRE